MTTLTSQQHGLRHSSLTACTLWSLLASSHHVDASFVHVDVDTQFHGVEQGGGQVVLPILQVSLSVWNQHLLCSLVSKQLQYTVGKVWGFFLNFFNF